MRDRGRARIPAGFSSVDWTGGRAVTSGHWSLGAGGRPWHTPSPAHCESAGSRPAGPSRTKKMLRNKRKQRTRKAKSCRESATNEKTSRLGKQKSAAAYSRAGGRAKLSNHGKESARGFTLDHTIPKSQFASCTEYTTRNLVHQCAGPGSRN